jgi:hypothetical protein
MKAEGGYGIAAMDQESRIENQGTVLYELRKQEKRSAKFMQADLCGLGF